MGKTFKFGEMFNSKDSWKNLGNAAKARKEKNFKQNWKSIVQEEIEVSGESIKDEVDMEWYFNSEE